MQPGLMAASMPGRTIQHRARNAYMYRHHRVLLRAPSPQPPSQAVRTECAPHLTTARRRHFTIASQPTSTCLQLPVPVPKVQNAWRIRHVAAGCGAPVTRPSAALAVHHARLNHQRDIRLSLSLCDLPPTHHHWPYPLPHSATRTYAMQHAFSRTFPLPRQPQATRTTRTRCVTPYTHVFCHLVPHAHSIPAAPGCVESALIPSIPSSAPSPERGVTRPSGACLRGCHQHTITSTLTDHNGCVSELTHTLASESVQ